ncbi:MAG: Calx-beta domain-containing protein [Isosphaeraceae bacterium]|nr:Calx-beta domain-containing protein [Isosphaeraceae bacterium]
MANDRTRPHSRRARQVRVGAERLEDRKLLTIDFQQGFYAVGDKAGAAVITLIRSDGTKGTANQTTETADLTVGGGTATPGVDYEPVSTTVTFGPGQTTQTVVVPILSDPGTGTKIVHMTIAQSSVTPEGSAAYLSIMHGPDNTPPQIRSTNLLTSRGLVTGFQITFSKPMDVAEATNVNNYLVDNPKALRRVSGTSVTTATPIAIQSASYNASTNTVTLVPAGRVRKAPYFELESTQLAQAMNAINGSTTANVPALSLMSPITDTAGNALDSNSDGIPDGQLLVFVAAGRLGKKLNNEMASIQATNTLANQT